MASTYVNDLRLNEMATGDQSGSWGTVTNTNLELIAEAFSYSTEAITTNADTHTTTIADGATDPGRSMFLKYTGTLDSACTITIGPNTVSKLWFIENATSGSQNIIIKQGSGATVTIASGKTKVIYSDGVGSGAKMVDAFAALDVGSLSTTGNLTVEANAPYIEISNTGENVGGIKMYDSGGASTQYFHLTYDAGASNTVGFDTGASGEYTFSVNTAEKMRIDSSGRVGIGTSSLSSELTIGADTPQIDLLKVSSADVLANIRAETDAGSGGKLVFQTKRNGNTSLDRMTIDDDGNVGIGADNPSGYGKFVVQGVGNLLNLNATSGVAYQAFYENGTGRFYLGTLNGSDGLAFIDADGSTERMRIDASGNVGIGTGSSALSAKLVVSGSNTIFHDSGGSALRFNKTLGTDTAFIANRSYNFHDGNGLAIATQDSNPIRFATNNTERMRIDASGNLLVGRTQTGDSTTGGMIRPDGFAQFTRDGGIAADFKRINSDGDIVRFQKDSNTVGTIGVASSAKMSIIGTNNNLQIGAAGSNIFNVSTASIYPDTDNSVDLGLSNRRFQDVYAVNFHGDGSNLTGVGGSTNFGDVGTYTVAHASGTASENATGIAHNGTVAGSKLVSSGKSTQVNQNPFGSANGTTAHVLDLNASGTWRNMSGGVRGQYDFYTYSSLWVRIS